MDPAPLRQLLGDEAAQTGGDRVQQQPLFRQEGPFAGQLEGVGIAHVHQAIDAVVDPDLRGLHRVAALQIARLVVAVASSKMSKLMSADLKFQQAFPAC